MWPRLGALLVVAACAAGDAERAGVPAGGACFTGGPHRGMSYAHAMRGGRGYGSEHSERSLRALRGLGVEWISITPFGFQRDAAARSFRWLAGESRGAGETDERLEAVTRQAHALGLKVMLKPHIWLRPPLWPGSIEPRSEADWTAWFATYEAFAVHYARLAREAGLDAFCVGNELAKTTAREAEWRRVIAAVRREYAGPLTYGAEAEEVFRVPFWDALDFIGVSAYYPLVAEPSPGRSALAEAWGPIVARLARLSASQRRKVVFTELGYRSARQGAWRHWEIEDTAPVDLWAQAEAYEAFFLAVWPQPWFGGVYWWKWFSHPGHSGPGSNDFELEGKPAELVVRRHYRRPPPRY
ncbi:MAG TPA: hypothetical protein VMT87_10025 [Vicinamibacteria bacterium]|nr:hypothetical protein [Vicinamibacteria bacterium]